MRGSNSRGVTRLSIDMDADQVDDYFCSIFPALLSTPYDYCYANAAGEIQAIESTLRSASDLHDFYVSTRAGTNIPTMYISPREQITYRPLGTSKYMYMCIYVCYFTIYYIDWLFLHIFIRIAV